MDTLYDTYSLDPYQYSSLINVGGYITQVQDESNLTVETDEEILVPVYIHPKVSAALLEENHILDVGDEIEILGTLISKEDSSLQVLALRCVVYQDFALKTNQLIN